MPKMPDWNEPEHQEDIRQVQELAGDLMVEAFRNQVQNVREWAAMMEELALFMENNEVHKVGALMTYVEMWFGDKAETLSVLLRMEGLKDEGKEEEALKVGLALKLKQEMGIDINPDQMHFIGSADKSAADGEWSVGPDFNKKEE